MNPPKFAVVNSSELGTACWSAKRFTGGCNTCNHVMTCKLKEASFGREMVYKQIIDAYEQKITQFQGVIEQRKAQIAKEQESRNEK